MVDREAFLNDDGVAAKVLVVQTEHYEADVDAVVVIVLDAKVPQNVSEVDQVICLPFLPEMVHLCKYHEQANRHLQIRQTVDAPLSFSFDLHAFAGEYVADGMVEVRGAWVVAPVTVVRCRGKAGGR